MLRRPARQCQRRSVASASMLRPGRPSLPARPRWPRCRSNPTCRTARWPCPTGGDIQERRRRRRRCRESLQAPAGTWACSVRRWPGPRGVVVQIGVRANRCGFRFDGFDVRTIGDSGSEFPRRARLRKEHDGAVPRRIRCSRLGRSLRASCRKRCLHAAGGDVHECPACCGWFFRAFPSVGYSPASSAAPWSGGFRACPCRQGRRRPPSLPLAACRCGERKTPRSLPYACAVPMRR